MSNVSRLELKYLLTPAQYLSLKNNILLYMRPDHFTAAVDKPGYLVRSLYFDTLDYRAFQEKLSGDFGRIKLRIRSYADQPTQAEEIRVEIKTKRGMVTTKHSSFVSLAWYQMFQKEGHWPGQADPVLAEFERLFYLRTLRPNVLVEYWREGFVPRLTSPLRVTFDHHVQSRASTELFPPRGHFRQHLPHRIVLEVKTPGDIPRWLNKLVVSHQLKLTVNSKYAQAVLLSRPDVSIGITSHSCEYATCQNVRSAPYAPLGGPEQPAQRGSHHRGS